MARTYKYQSWGCDSQSLESINSLTKTDGENFWIKQITNGPEVGHLVNPLSQNHKPANYKEFNSIKGCNLYEWVKVNEATFRHYQKFLETKSEAWFRNAERERF